MASKKGFKGPDHGWQGGGRFRVARIDGRLIVRFNTLTSNTGKLKSDIGAFFRKDYRLRADHRPYHVRIWVEFNGIKIDADNVAKAVLDAMTGWVWIDDSQVMRLLVEKVAGETDAVTVAVGPAEPSQSEQELRALIGAADAAT